MYKRKYFFDFYCFIFYIRFFTLGKQLDIERVIFESEVSIIFHYQCQLGKSLLVKFHHRITKETEEILELQPSMFFVTT